MKNFLILSLVLKSITLIGLFGLLEGHDGKIPALFAFGDSILDTGNNNFLPSAAKCNFPPYGRDYNGGIPTGRFGNGKVLSDLIISGFQIKDTIPAYLDPMCQGDEIRTGVNFASGGSGFDSVTATMLSVIWVPNQVKMFEQYKVKLAAKVGEPESNNIISNSIFLLSSGNNDIAITYFRSSTRRLTHDVPAYSAMLTNLTSTFLQDLYKLGARKFIVLSTLPLGCLPISTLVSIKCDEEQNAASQTFNNMLSDMVCGLQKTMPDTQMMFFDLYTPMLEVINNPQKHGFTDSSSACCCTAKAVIPCLDDTHVFYDYAHPTEKAYKIVAPMIIDAYKKQFP